MTDSLKVSLDLRKLPVAQRHRVPLLMGTDADQHGDILARFAKPQKQDSPMSRTKTKWLVRTEPLEVDGCRIDVATTIEADLNLPNALTGQNLEHGTSVYAAGHATLWLLKIWLAAAGIDRMYLRQLDLSDVRLLSATLTYLVKCLSEADAEALVHDLRTTTHILSSRAQSYQSSNETVMLPTGFGAMSAYHKTLLKFCKMLDGAPEAHHLEANRLLVRLESKLNSAFLSKTGLDTLAGWRDAYATGLYEALYEQTIVKPLQLDLRHNRPRPEALARLTRMQRGFVEFYLEGGNPYRFSAVLASAFPAQTLSKLRIAIRDILDIDVDIPWKKHQELRCFKLRHRLGYPGDYFPPADRATWCFCQESWGQMLKKLEECFEDAITPHEWGKPVSSSITRFGRTT